MKQTTAWYVDWW